MNFAKSGNKIMLITALSVAMSSAAYAQSGENLSVSKPNVGTTAGCIGAAVGCIPLLVGEALGCSVLEAFTAGAITPGCAFLLSASGVACAVEMAECPKAVKQFYQNRLAWIGDATVGEEDSGSCQGGSLISQIDGHYVIENDRTRITKLVVHCDDGNYWVLGTRSGDKIDTVTCNTGHLASGIKGYIRVARKNLQKLDIECRNPVNNAGAYKSLYIGLFQPKDSIQVQLCARGAYLSGLAVRVADPYTNNSYIAGISATCKK